ncbi:MAG: Na+/H+ antiporter NhaC family protein [Candidatus Babeliales bacterium]
MSVEKYRPLHSHIFTLSPFFLFFGLFLSSTLFMQSSLSPIVFCLIALGYAFITLPSSLTLNDKIMIALQGSAQPIIITMTYIFIFSSIFTYAATAIGSIDAAVSLGLYFLPHAALLPGIFIIVSFFSLSVGTSMGAIAAFLPIAYALAQKLTIPAPLMAGIVVNAAMFGDNLSLISDTTIASIQVTHSNPLRKYKVNAMLVLLPFVATLILLVYQNSCYSTIPFDIPIINATLWLKLIPYCIVTLLSFLGIDVLISLFIGICSTIAIGFSLNLFSLTDGLNIFIEGFRSPQSGLHETIMLVLLIGALSHIINYNGGIQSILTFFSKIAYSAFSAELTITLLVFITNCFIAINTITLIVAGPLAHTIGSHYHIRNERTAALIDIAACISQGILPYAPQLLLASTLAHTTPLAIIPYLYYQFFCIIAILGSIIINQFSLHKNV